MIQENDCDYGGLARVWPLCERRRERVLWDGNEIFFLTVTSECETVQHGNQGYLEY